MLVVSTESEFRESADPSYPELYADTFADVFKTPGITGKKLKISLGSYIECTLSIYEDLKERFPEAVTLERLPEIKHWFTESAKEANKELGDEMVRRSLEYLEKPLFNVVL